jgi:hypothetical protein
MAIGVTVNPVERKRLAWEIEIVRRELEKKSENGDLGGRELLLVSERLDRLIFEYLSVPANRENSRGNIG